MEVDPTSLKRSTLVEVSEPHAFWTCRGDKITRLRDLAECIDHLALNEFQHHVSDDGKQNDFSVWVHDVLHNPLLARDLSYPLNTKDQHHYAKTIRDHIAWLETV